MKARFVKLSGAGNDFVLIDRPARKPRDLARRLCDRRGGIGADGLLLVLGKGLHPRLNYYNKDGSAAFCGNGARCAALWLGRDRVVFTTGQGPIEAKITGRQRAAIRLPAPRGLRLGLRLSALGRTFAVHAVDTGVPHAVVPVARLDRFPVERFGRALRFHRAFGRAGANVDFVELGRPLRARTYERGVESETLACGTGAAAVAAVAAALGRARLPASVAMPGGILRVSEEARGGALWLDGPARITYTGEISL